MTDQAVISLAREAVLTVLLVAGGPALGIGMLVGLVVSIFQATTQIQEQTLTFIPKSWRCWFPLSFLAPG